jgi:phosphoribosylamine--glycine ligase
VKTLVIGAGGREHALAWRLARDPDVSGLVCAPGNPGMAAIARCVPVDMTRPESMLELAATEGIDLTVIGPEAPLDQGVADIFRRAGRAIVGPGKAGAALECSKAFAKAFMERHAIPTARFVVCDEAAAAVDVVRRAQFGFPVVVKADGLAAGKGVIIADDVVSAEEAIEGIMIDRRFGAAGARVVLEEHLSGPEVSFFVLCDGEDAVVLGTAQDHKRIFDGDRGPNTGGMGAFAPSPLIDEALSASVVRDVVQPVLRGMAAEHEPYRGFLYVSLMLTASGPKVIEFNVRLGDPETQVVLPLIEGPFAALLHGSATGRLPRAALATSVRRYVGVVLASRGYPAGAESGRIIDGLDRAGALDDVLVFHAGTRATSAGIVSAGGRVLTVVGGGDTFAGAMAAAYRGVDAIHFDGMQYRRDIGRKALEYGSTT